MQPHRRKRTARFRGWFPKIGFHGYTNPDYALGLATFDATLSLIRNDRLL